MTQSEEKKEWNGFAFGFMILCMIGTIVTQNTGYYFAAGVMFLGSVMAAAFIATPG